jgi:hypothetical protein
MYRSIFGIALACGFTLATLGQAAFAGQQTTVRTGPKGNNQTTTRTWGGNQQQTVRTGPKGNNQTTTRTLNR